MSDELARIEKIIESRKKEALKKEIWKKLDKIVRILGDYSDYGGGEYNYSEKGLSIYYEAHFQNYIVDLGYNTYEVFRSCHRHSKSPDISMYIPGEWELRIDELYEKCSNDEKEREKEALQRKINKTKEKWRIE